MDSDKLNRLLNTACEIITSLEGYADAELQKEIDAFFDEIVNANEDTQFDGKKGNVRNGDDEAQDYDTFGENKI
jgi:hypothetical protein